MIYRLLLSLLIASNLQGQTDMELVDSLTSERKFTEAIQLLEESYVDKDTVTKLRYLSELGILHGKNMEYEKAFELLEQALKGFKSLENDTMISYTLYGIAKLFSDRYEYDKQYKYIKEAMLYASTRKDSAKLISNMGVYFRNKNQLDSARICYLKGIELYPKDGDPEFFFINYNNLAILEKTEKNFDKALEYYERASQIAKDLKEWTSAASIEVNKTYVYYDLKEFEKAEKVLNENEELVMSTGATLEKLNFDLIRYNIAEKLGKTSETLKYYQRYRKTKDSVDNLKLNTKIAEFEVKYETAEKEKELALQGEQLAKSKVQKQYLWGGLIGAIWLGLFGTLFYWSRNRYQKKLADEKLQVMVMESMLDGQENERMRIATDLHDSLGGLLTTIKLHFDGIQQLITEWATKEKTSNVSKLIDRASQEVRRISHNMAPRALNLSGLEAALGDLSTEINASGKISVSYEWHGGEIPEEDRIMIYRIVEEACANVIKHAKAEHLFIQVNVFKDGYSIMVEDDGQGFDPHTNKGMGLRNMKSRAAILKADFNVDTMPGKGTTILMSKGDVQ